ncbi:MAG TPA: glycosyl transferase family 8 [Candidatus Nanoarchaeia archaeon]|nr:glycosyl transferase family 8 [Candidatus Nanoarchaeia archaeon]
MKNVIFTSSDEKYGDFLVTHWLRSLKDNVDLTNTDVIVLDYGLTEIQVSELKRNNVIVHKAKKDGAIVNIRWREMAIILKRKEYDQVLSVDGGDIIFQDGISSIFSEDTGAFRAAYEGTNKLYKSYFLKTCFSRKVSSKMKECLHGKKIVNAGVLLGPSYKFIGLCNEIVSLIEDKGRFGPDQIIINYVLQRDGFKELNPKYNFIISTLDAKDAKFTIKEGVLYLQNGQKIPIVHNAGRYSMLRPLKNFGYGKGCNKQKILTHLILRTMYRLFDSVLLR